MTTPTTIATFSGCPVPQTHEGMQAWADKIDAALSGGPTLRLTEYNQLIVHRDGSVATSTWSVVPPGKPLLGS